MENSLYTSRVSKAIELVRQVCTRSLRSEKLKKQFALFAAIKKGEYLYKDFRRGVNSTLTAILGRMATYSGQKISWDEALSSNLDIVPNNLTSFEDSAPVYPDKQGKYPIPIPGVTKFI